jgi:DnaJ-class molecular chaperone
MSSNKCAQCEECDGRGIVVFHTNEGPYNREYEGWCPECDGTGEIELKTYLDSENEDI